MFNIGCGDQGLMLGHVLGLNAQIRVLYLILTIRCL